MKASKNIKSGVQNTINGDKALSLETRYELFGNEELGSLCGAQYESKLV